MTLDEIYNKWQSIQPLSETDQNKLSMRFTVEYNYNSNHLEGNTLTYGQTELLLLFGKVSGEGRLKDFNDMKASEVSVKMMKGEAANKKEPLTQNFIRTLWKSHATLTLLAKQNSPPWPKGSKLHGFSRYSKKYKYTENMLRKEHNLQQRLSHISND